MRITESPMVPEVNDADPHWRTPLPTFKGGPDADLVAALAGRINDGQRLMSDWAILAFVRAVRVEFPDGGFNPESGDHWNVVAQRVGYVWANAARTMAAKVMRGLAELREKMIK